MKRLKAIIVDDEPRSAGSLRVLLEDYCPQVELLTICMDPRRCIAMIREQRPELLFLDVEMPHLNGFAVLTAVRSFIRHVVFTTAHDKYAVQALREQALDFLLKPVDPAELVRSVDRAMTDNSSGLLLESLERIGRLEKLLRKHHASQIAVQTAAGLTVVPHNEIIRMEAESNYTHIFSTKKKYTVAKLLGYYEEQLSPGFVRVHSSHLVNLNHVKNYQRGDGGYLVMSDGATVEVSRSRKKELMRILLGEE